MIMGIKVPSSNVDFHIGFKVSSHNVSCHTRVPFHTLRISFTNKDLFLHKRMGTKASSCKAALHTGIKVSSDDVAGHICGSLSTL